MRYRSLDITRRLLVHLPIREAVVRPLWMRVGVACMPRTSAGQHIPHLQPVAHKEVSAQVSACASTQLDALIEPKEERRARNDPIFAAFRSVKYTSRPQARASPKAWRRRFCEKLMQGLPY
ncbi:hypothetical protein LIA77_05889 [Sarocladium implicatum]|nr:hypothetical protein LIA77_05889 [Sarocladium implicatum]